MKEYIYNGPLSGVSLNEGEDAMLHPGATVELPEDHPYTIRLVKRGWLTELPADRKSKIKKEPTDVS